MLESIITRYLKVIRERLQIWLLRYYINDMNCLTPLEDPLSLSQWELKGIVELALFLLDLTSKFESNSEATTEERQIIKDNIPDEVSDPIRLTKRLCRRINRIINQGNMDFDEEESEDQKVISKSFERNHDSNPEPSQDNSVNGSTKIKLRAKRRVVDEDHERRVKWAKTNRSIPPRPPPYNYSIYSYDENDRESSTSPTPEEIARVEQIIKGKIREFELEKQKEKLQKLEEKEMFHWEDV
jgi:hypothetical protein